MEDHPDKASIKYMSMIFVKDKNEYYTKTQIHGEWTPDDVIHL